MMSRFFLLCCMSAMLGLLVSCQSQEADYNYYMQHPVALKKELESCQAKYESKNTLSPHCQNVVKAANEVMALVEEQQRHPQDFGQRILTLQTQCSSTNNPEICIEEKTLLAVVGLSSPE